MVRCYPVRFVCKGRSLSESECALRKLSRYSFKVFADSLVLQIPDTSFMRMLQAPGEIVSKGSFFNVVAHLLIGFPKRYSPVDQFIYCLDTKEVAILLVFQNIIFHLNVLKH